jgi:hypothetical protein
VHIFGVKEQGNRSFGNTKQQRPPRIPATDIVHPLNRPSIEIQLLGERDHGTASKNYTFGDRWREYIREDRESVQ